MGIPAEIIAHAKAAPNGDERARVVATAWGWQGTPWAHQCRRKGSGVDCGNFIAGVFIEAGVLPDVPMVAYPIDFYFHSKGEVFRENLERFTRRINAVVPLPGDILGYRLGRNTPSVCHAAIVLDWPRIIHAHRGARCVQLDDGDKGQYPKICSGIWRFNSWSED